MNTTELRAALAAEYAAEPDYRVENGTRVSLNALCSEEPAWAASRIRHMREMLRIVPRLLDVYEAGQDYALSSAGDSGEVFARWIAALHAVEANEP